MRSRLPDYRSFVFDCDGVILDSNGIKSEAFHAVSRRFGADIADRFVRYHQAQGGVSRYQKFAYLLDEIIEQPVADREALLAELLADFAGRCAAALLDCPLIPGVASVLARIPAGAATFVVTGGDQEEVRTAFAARGLDRHFREILGSPRPKREHMVLLAARGEIGPGSIYFGDAELDMRLADEFGLEFVFVEGASEWPAGREICSARRIRDFTDIPA